MPWRRLIFSLPVLIRDNVYFADSLLTVGMMMLYNSFLYCILWSARWFESPSRYAKSAEKSARFLFRVAFRVAWLYKF